MRYLLMKFIDWRYNMVVSRAVTLDLTDLNGESCLRVVLYQQHTWETSENVLELDSCTRYI